MTTGRSPPARPPGQALAGDMKQKAAAKAAQAAVGAAKDKMADTAKAARDAKLALELVSIFISRATQKLYVRRDTHTRVPDGGRRSTRHSPFRSQSAILAHLSARMCSRPWRRPTG